MMEASCSSNPNCSSFLLCFGFGRSEMASAGAITMRRLQQQTEQTQPGKSFTLVVLAAFERG